MKTPYRSLSTQLSRFPSMKKAGLLSGSLVSSALLVFVVPGNIKAANATWTGGGTTSAWDEAANWGVAASAPGAVGTNNNADAAIFNSAPAGKMSVSIDAGRNLKSLTFLSGAGSYTIGTTSGTALLLTTGTVAGTGILVAAGVTTAQTIDAPLVLTPASATDGGIFVFDSKSSSTSATLTLNGSISAGAGSSGTTNISLGNSGAAKGNFINGVISDGGGIVSLSNQSSSSSWTLTGSNSYSGGTSIAGTLKISDKDALGSGTVTITSAAGGVTNVAASRLALKNDFNVLGAMTTTGDLTIDGKVEVSGAASLAITLGGETIINGVISGTAGINRSGGGTLTLTGSNTFTGGVTLGNGISNINHSHALGTGVLKFSGGTVGNTSGSAVTIANDIVATSALNFNLVNDLTLTGALSGTGNHSVKAVGATVTMNGTISDGASALVLLKESAGTLTLGGSNTFSGGVTLTDGKLNINHASALGTGTFSVASSKTIDNTSGGKISVTTANQILLNNSLNFTGSNDLDLGSGAVTLNSNTAITVADKTLTFGGALTSAASRSWSKAGTGTLVLSGSSTISGTATVSAGVLRLATANALSGGVGATGGLSALNLNGGVVELTGSTANFTRTLGTGVTQVQIGAVGGGFSAHGADVAVNLGAATWGGTGWSNTAKLMLSSAVATHTVDFQGALNLKNTVGDLTRVIEVANGTAKIDAKISGNIANTSGTAGINKTGTGTLELTGVNTYNGLTTVSAGTLLVNGSIFNASAAGVRIESEAILGGHGSVQKVSGAGTLSAGNSAGIFTTTLIDGSEGMDFLFEFTAATVAGESLPDFGNAASSGNDVVRITGASPFSQALTISNTITVDLRGLSISFGDVFFGGFFAATDFFNSVEDAQFVYLGLNGGLLMEVATVAQSANFGSGTTAGYITQFTVVPEPTSSLLILAGGTAGLMLARRRKMAKAA